MAITNLITDNYIQSCEYNQGGINRIWFGEYDGIYLPLNGGARFNYSMNKLGNIQEIDWAMWELDMSLIEVNFQTNYDTAIRKFVTTFSLNFSQMENTWDIVRKFENGRYIIGWGDNTGNYWMAGLDTGFRVDPSSSQWGTAGAGRYWNISMRESSRQAPYKVNSGVLNLPVTTTTGPIDEWEPITSIENLGFV